MVGPGTGSAELVTRVLTAAALIAASIAALTLCPTPVIAALLGAIVLLGAWEWSALAGITGRAMRIGYVALTALLLGAFYRWIEQGGRAPAVALPALAWWAFAAFLIIRFQVSARPPPPGLWWRLPAGWAIMLPAWGTLVLLHLTHGPAGVFALLVLIWVADSAAYLFGRRYGRRRLASRVSPGKSWEGLIAAVVAAALFATPSSVWVAIPGDLRWHYVLLAVAVVLLSVIGDLTESLFKRVAGLKDSGSLLPGHGGVLDRVDSLTAAAPGFLLGLYCLEGSA
jgi:phosphatidate cytidylyltransferase